MKRLTDFFKSKGFYIALGTGVLAFAGLLAVYSYDDTRKELLEEPAIDLNQPAELDDGSIDSEYEISAETGSDSVIADKSDGDETAGATDASEVKEIYEATETEISTQDEITTHEEIEVISDAAVPDSREEIEAGLEYDGEQTLAWPLIGNVILPYSMDTTVYYQTLQTYKCNPGMLIQGDEGSDVFAAYEGVVTAVEDTKQYGTVVKVDMGNGYGAMYGQLQNVCVSTGTTVSKAQTIGEVGPVSSYFTEEGSHLYFAITKDGEAVNPMTLIQ